MVKVEPLPPTAQAPDAQADDGLYAGATHAIDQRNYATALDLLQDARERAPNDVRVLNALGVIYDKLGRFDLSGRYYSQAQVIDPASPIVSHNVAYSTLLQAAQRGEKPPALAAAAEPKVAAAAPKLAPDSGAALVQVGPNVWKLNAATPSQPITLGLTGHPLMLTDASGRPGLVEPIRSELVRRGWTAPVGAVTNAAPQATSEIVYAPPAEPAARALAKTLAVNVRMDACSNGCEGVRLILGADSGQWALTAKHASARRRA
jgi:hypothetical protein